MKTSEILLNSVSELWHSFSRHPFILSLQNGTLERELFRNYIIEDTLYLADYARVFAVGTAKAQDTHVGALFASYIGIMHGEMDVHHGYLEKLNVTTDELKNAKPKLNNLAYTSYMLRVAYEETPAEILAAVLPCAYSYEVIARKMTDNAPDCTKDNFYGEWIESYASEEYSRGNKVLIETLDRLSADYTPEKISHLADIFRYCSLFEMEFWNASADGKM